jgi:hypothetical protein
MSRPDSLGDRAFWSKSAFAKVLRVRKEFIRQAITDRILPVVYLPGRKYPVITQQAALEFAKMIDKKK